MSLERDTIAAALIAAAIDAGQQFYAETPEPLGLASSDRRTAAVFLWSPAERATFAALERAAQDAVYLLALAGFESAWAHDPMTPDAPASTAGRSPRRRSLRTVLPLPRADTYGAPRTDPRQDAPVALLLARILRYTTERHGLVIMGSETPHVAGLLIETFALGMADTARLLLPDTDAADQVLDAGRQGALSVDPDVLAHRTARQAARQAGLRLEPGPDARRSSEAHPRWPLVPDSVTRADR